MVVVLSVSDVFFSFFFRASVLFVSFCIAMGGDLCHMFSGFSFCIVLLPRYFGILYFSPSRSVTSEGRRVGPQTFSDRIFDEHLTSTKLSEMV